MNLRPLSVQSELQASLGYMTKLSQRQRRGEGQESQVGMPAACEVTNWSPICFKPGADGVHLPVASQRQSHPWAAEAAGVGECTAAFRTRLCTRTVY